MTDKSSHSKAFLILAVLIFSFSCLNPVTGAALNIDLNAEDEFSPGETVSFNYTISSDAERTITYKAEIECDMPIPQPTLKTVDIGPENSVKSELIGSQVTENTRNQVCSAQVSILSPAKIEQEEEFRIRTKPGFEFKLRVCEDASCANETKIIYKNRKTYLDYTSKVSNLSVEANLVLPNDEREGISLLASRKLSRVGIYTLQATASKQGYKTTQDSTQFAVIDKPANITTETPQIPGLKAEVCSDRNCDQEIESIEKDKSVWLDFSADLTDVSLSSQLVYPKGTSREVELPHQISLDRAGDYELEVTGFKQGYRKTTDSRLFVVKRSGNVPGEKEKTGGIAAQVLNYAPYLILIIALLISIIIYFSLVSQKK